jgi:hypothetical protein
MLFVTAVPQAWHGDEESVRCDGETGGHGVTWVSILKVDGSPSCHKLEGRHLRVQADDAAKCKQQRESGTEITLQSTPLIS